MNTSLSLSHLSVVTCVVELQSNFWARIDQQQPTTSTVSNIIKPRISTNCGIRTSISLVRFRPSTFPSHTTGLFSVESRLVKQLGHKKASLWHSTIFFVRKLGFWKYQIIWSRWLWSFFITFQFSCWKELLHCCIDQLNRAKLALWVVLTVRPDHSTSLVFKRGNYNVGASGLVETIANVSLSDLWAILTWFTRGQWL